MGAWLSEGDILCKGPRIVGGMGEILMFLRYAMCGSPSAGYTRT